MTGLRYLYVLALAAWLGGMLAIWGLAMPAVASVLRGSTGHLLVEPVFGDLLRRYHVAAYACGGIMLATLVGMRVLGPRPVQFAVRGAIVLAMLVVTAYSGLFAADQDLSLRLMLVNAAGALAVLYWEAKE